MNRKQFIEKHGATCSNWTWSWSFVNHRERFVIFGIWNDNVDTDMSLILSEGWQKSNKGRIQNGYVQAIEHIKLIDNEGYALKTFVMEYVEQERDGEEGPAKIGGFTPELNDMQLIQVGNDWFAQDRATQPKLVAEEIESNEDYFEGASKSVLVNQYERNSKARAQCLNKHGYQCKVCEFDFKHFYGGLGKEYIHVHHIVPISEIGQEYQIDPESDLVPVCANCHAMIHRTRPAQSVEGLRNHLRALGSIQ
ncbi:HNH endonuclease [Salinicola aestuarinus]|uniref:HNH endonuclease n=1 Tax=Salinicola aestuarinus TaxID=1949082 RepID=UPI000DA24218|nr:HNH endonuclease [Salinicola aestuarinus]